MTHAHNAMQTHMHAAHMAQKHAHQAMAQARQGAAIAAAVNRRAAAQARRSQAIARQAASRAAAQHRHDEAVRRRQALIESLYRAVLRPLDCIPFDHAQGTRSLLMARNWTDSKGSDHVVLHCNTSLPGSGRPAALMLWTDRGVEWVDLVTASVGELARKGRLFFHVGNLTLPEGDSFVVLPAHHEGGGEVGHWSFPTAGSFQGKPFFVGPGGFGTFIERRLQDHMVARPITFSDADRNWIWYGRSSVHDMGKLRIVARSPFDRGGAELGFLLAPMDPARSIAALRCRLRDDQGDWLAVVDTNAGRRHVIVERKEVVYLMCRPNARLRQGQSVFVAPTRRATDGAMVFAGSGTFRGKELAFEVEANQKDAKGRSLLVVRADALLGGKPVAAIALRKLTPSERARVR